ncbi:MAG: mobilization protein, partial [Cyanobacteria bacterium J06623_1]
DAVEHLGLERGIKGSLAKHQDIKDFYRIVEEGKDLEVNRLNQAQLKAKAADRERAEKKKSEMEATAKRLSQDNGALCDLNHISAKRSRYALKTFRTRYAS